MATDLSLDRPVLVRFLSLDASPERRGEYLSAVKDAAAITHVHLAGVYAMGTTESGVFSILEWNGGVSITDRLRARETLPVHEFLPNAAGLAAGLAALHGSGANHGAIDTGAIQFSAAHPAKLGGYGRRRRYETAAEDTAALAVALRVAITGSAEPGVRPSQVAEGLPRAVDDALDAAESGALDAAGLAAALRSVPYRPQEMSAETGWSWRWLVPAGLLLAAALLIAAAGSAIEVDPNSPFLFPATPSGSTTSSPSPGTTVAPPVTEPGIDGALGVGVQVYDPFGDGTERDAELGGLTDGDPDTAWRTERYFSPLSSVKPGVGLIFGVDGTPSVLELVASTGTRYQVGWAPEIPNTFDGWEMTGSGAVIGGPGRLQLPHRVGGVWLLWFTDVPDLGESEYGTVVTEVRFLP